LVEVTVHEIGEPATTGVVFNTFVLTSAADVVTVPVAVGLVHALVTIAFVQAVSDVTTALLSTDDPLAADDFTVPSIVTCALVASATVGNVHATELPVTAQLPVPSATVAVMAVTVAGTVSEITTFFASDGPSFVVVSVHSMGEPATTGDVFNTFVFTSAVEPPADADAVHAAAPGQLFADTGSGVELVTVNEFEMVEPAEAAETVPETVTMADAASASVANVQERVWPLTRQLPPPLNTFVVMPLTLEGTTSDIVTEVASDGPLLRVVSVHSMPEPAITGFVSSTFDDARSAEVVTEPGAVGSVQAPLTLESHNVDEVTVAVLSTESPSTAFGLTVPSMVTRADAAAATVANVQETSWPLMVHDPPAVGDAVKSVMSDGTVSAMTTPCASDGPWLADVSVHWMGAPATTGVVFSTFVFTRAAEVVTVPGAVGLVHAPLTPESHGVTDVTFAVLSTRSPATVDADTVPEIEMVTVAASASVAYVQVSC